LTPPQIDARLNREIIAALAAQDVAARFAELGITTPAMTPDDLRDFVAAETARWGTVARRANIRAE
jgi:tripartite-type tricarboxylate transporter receptor subunit TctC